MKLCLISEGGFGDFLLHLDAVRQLIGQEDNVEVFVCASEPKIKVGELISDFVQEWAILNSHSAKKLISTSDVLIEHRWFARINRPSLLPNTDLSLYNLFDLGRGQGAAALRHYFDQGMTLRDIIVKSLGIQPDENLFPYNRCQDVISQIHLSNLGLPENFVVVCNDADSNPAKWQTKQIPHAIWSEIIEVLLEMNLFVVEIGSTKRVSSITHSSYRDLRGATSELQWASLLNHNQGLLTIEGGSAHLSAVLQKPAFVICGPTDSKIYGHNLHQYITSGFCSPCHWTTLDWFRRCPAGINQACLYGLDAKAVSEEFVLWASKNWVTPQ